MSGVLRAAVLALALVPALGHGGPTGEPEPELRRLLAVAIADTDSYFDDRYDAEIWLVIMSDRLSKFMPDGAERLELLRLVLDEANRAHLAPELVLAVIEVESRFDRYAISSAGALGLMQIMPFWLKEIGRPDDNLFDLPTNLRMGCTILRYYLDRERGNLTPALQRYNGSYGRPDYPFLVERARNQRWIRD